MILGDQGDLAGKQGQKPGLDIVITKNLMQTLSRLASFIVKFST